MDDVTGAVAEDRVVLVLALDGEAPRAALLQAVELLVAEIPAARPLHDVAADGAHVPNLRRADFIRRGGQRREQLSCRRVLGEIGELDGRADPEPAVAGRNRRIEVLEIDDPLGRDDVVLHQAEEVHAAGHRQEAATLGRERGDRLFLVRGIDVGEGFQFVPPARSSSAISLSGVIGMLRIVAPVALRTALAIAAAVATAGGSPIPITPRSG